MPPSDTLLYRKTLFSLFVRFFIGFLVGLCGIVAVGVGSILTFLYKIPYGIPIFIAVGAALVGTLFVLTMWADRIPVEQNPPEDS